MSPRDNRDEIPADDLRIDRQDEKLALRWRRKDKLRSATVVGASLRVEFEEVDWGSGDEFAMLWVVAGGVVRPLYPMRHSEAEFVRRDRVGAGFKNVFRIDVPLNAPNMPAVGRYGLLMATPTVRSAIRAYEMERQEEPEEPEQPTEPEEPVSEPASLLESVEEERAKYPARITDDEAGAIINAVAWRHRHDGWGVARKDIGASAPQPGTRLRISRDILIHAPSRRMYDVLSSVSDGQAKPAWNFAGPQDMEFVEAVRPEGQPAPPDDEQVPDDETGGEDSEAPGGPSISDRLDEIDRQTAAIRAMIGEDT